MAKTNKKSGDVKTESKSPAKSTAAKKPAVAETKSAAKKPAAPKPAAKPAAKPMPMMGIDTSYVAESAARMLSAGINVRGGAKSSQPNKPESSLFKQLKSGLSKPSSTTMNNLLDKTHGPGMNKQQGFNKQVGHNQTIGSDAARTNVPRRTNG